MTLAETKSQVFLTFDNNGKFADFGVKNTSEIGISGTPLGQKDLVRFGGSLAGVEMSNSISINGGSKNDIEWKGILAPIFGK
ncbi:MAG TPA: hypothetical protein VM871_04800, partial [Flavisolibacter sp.]|nr:hypothetical protein [Flavisolibacter sp.]